MITIAALRAVGATEAKAAEILDAVSLSCALYDITTPARIAAFLAQVGHESGGFRYTSEIWGPTPAQQRYEGRKDLGNTQPGDGSRYRGHGYIQTTGRANHAAVRDRLRQRLSVEVPDFEEHPEALAELPWACLSAADYWDMRKLNALADAGDFEAITRKVNGGLNGYADRIARWERVKAALNVSEQPTVITDAAPVGTTQPKEQPMAPFVAAVLPSLIDLVPKLGRLFSSGSEVSERNIKAAEIVVSAAKEAIGARNEQELMETIKADPSAAATVKKAIEDQWFKLEEIGGGVQAARVADAQFTTGTARPWHSPSLWIALAMLPMVYAVVGSVVGWWGTPFSEDVRSAIANGVIGVVMGGLMGYYFGQTTSRNRGSGGA